MAKEAIFIYGAPGVGKTTFSQQLHRKLSLPLIEGDVLREITAQQERTKEEDPFVYRGVKDAFHEFGAFTNDHVIKGLKAVRKSMLPYVAKEIAAQKGLFILEASFLEPSQVIPHGRLVLVTEPNEQKHRKQYFEHRPQNENQFEKFQAARIIQKYLIGEAKNLSILCVENDADVEATIAKLEL